MINQTNKNSMSLQLDSSSVKGVPDSTTAEKGWASNEFMRLHLIRNSRLEVKREAASLTLPFLLPPEGHTDEETLPTPYQSFGSRAVNNLASKLTITLLPPSSPFFKRQIAPERLNQVRNEEGLEDVIKQALVANANTIQQAVDESNARVTLHKALTYQIITGDALIEFIDEKTLRTIRNDFWVVVRDAKGHMVKLIVKELLHPSELEESDPIREMIMPEASSPNTPGKIGHVEVFTVIKKVSKDKFLVWQETNKGVKIMEPKTQREVELSYMTPLRWDIDDCSSYGRGHVEGLMGDFKTLEGFSELAIKGSAALAKILFLVNPTGMTKYRDVQQAETGDFVSGNEGDITVLSSGGRVEDLLNAIQITVGPVTKRLSEAFLLTSSIQRDAERVTAAEFRTLAEDLDNALGGQFSAQALEFQRRFLNRMIHLLEKKKRITNYGDVIRESIITGLEALGRGHELFKLTDAVNVVNGVEGASQYIKKGGFVRRVFEKFQIDTDGLIFTDEEIKAQNEDASKIEAMEKFGPQILGQAMQPDSGAKA